MNLQRFVSWWYRDASRPACQPTHRRRPAIERLESRDVPSALGDTYVATLYQGLLGRPVDQAGLQFWSAPLDQGATPLQVAEGIVHSDEYRGRQVQDVFQALLGRNADPMGLVGFVGDLQAGQSIEQVKADVFGSDEFFSRAGGSSTSFLNVLFQNALGRAPDPASLTQTAATTISAGARTALAGQILTGPEARQREVGNLFRAVLGREPDAMGVSFWTAALNNGTRDEDVLAGFLSSGEYLGNLQKALGLAGGNPNASAQAFLTRINQFAGNLNGTTSPLLDTFGADPAASFHITTTGLPFGPLPFAFVISPGVAALQGAPAGAGFSPSLSNPILGTPGLVTPGVSPAFTVPGLANLVPGLNAQLATLSPANTGPGLVPTLGPQIAALGPGLTPTLPSPSPVTQAPGFTPALGTQLASLGPGLTPSFLVTPGFGSAIAPPTVLPATTFVTPGFNPLSPTGMF